MTENDIKQKLSFHYVGFISTYSGYRFDQPFTDYGVDAVIEKIEKVQINGTNRYVASGKSIDVQLKSTSGSKIIQQEDIIKFDLEVKSYNDLIRRYQRRDQALGNLIPLILVLFILPDDMESSIDLSNLNYTQINASAYWIYPNETWTISSNKSSVRVEIPIKNCVDLDFCDKIFNLLHDK